MAHVKLSENFWDYEFRCKCGCGQLRVHPGFIASLQRVRNRVFIATGMGMTVLSGCRCKAHNDRPAVEGGAGGHKNSLHVCDFAQHIGQQGALGVDIAAIDGFYRGTLFQVAWSEGFSVGWNAARKFLHLDRRDFVNLRQNSFDY